MGFAESINAINGKCLLIENNFNKRPLLPFLIAFFIYRLELNNTKYKPGLCDFLCLP